MKEPLDLIMTNFIRSNWWCGLASQQKNKLIDYLEERVETYKSDLICRICMEGAVQRAFKPCGHVVCAGM